jgi:hypothetical protein
MRPWFMLSGGAGILASVSACGEPLGPLPPLAAGARTTGGSSDVCGDSGAQHSAAPAMASHSPEIDQRLARDFPRGSASARLRGSLAAQGFQLYGSCSLDRSIHRAAFSQRGGNGITAMPAFVTVHWKEDKGARIVWATGDISSTGM